jgi:xanthine dehydrogenase accessory factor
VDVGRAVEGWGVLERAVDLARRGEPFVLATVVWREGPSSGQHGARAIYTADGEMHGWIGGACAEPVFKREAVKTLEAGTPRLLALGASDRFGELPQGTMAVEMSCQSEGALQIYLEPVMSMPHLVIVGDSPMAQTLAQQAAQLDWTVELVNGPDFSEGMVSTNSIVVIATQGHGDEDALISAFKAEPAYVGVVASAKRGASIKEFLEGQSIEPARLDALRIPAGLDLGPTTHKEMSVAILAELVQRRAAGDFTRSVTIDAPKPDSTVDPICGMTVDAVPTSNPFVVGDETYYFCCPGCRAAFESQQGA